MAQIVRALSVAGCSWCGDLSLKALPGFKVQVENDGPSCHR